ncbi:MAG: hypothetical protein ABFR36_07750 [Acidobacteriota bacterium]
MKKLLVILLLYSFVFIVNGKKIAEFEDIYNLIYFYIDGNDLYAIDGEGVKHFSIRDMELKRIIGKKGEGPGEYKGFPRVKITHDQIMITGFTKILFFSRNGEYINEVKKPVNYSANIVGKNILVTESDIDSKNRLAKSSVWVSDKNFNKIRDLYSYERKLPEIPEKKSVKLKFDRELFHSLPIAVTGDENIYVYRKSKNFSIDIYNSMGDKVRTLKREVTLVKITEEFKKNFIAFMDQNRVKVNDGVSFDWNYIFTEYIPPITYLRVQDNKLYITTYDKTGKNKKISMMDMNGKILKKGMVPLKYKSVMDEDKIYYMIDNENDEVWELHMVSL